MASINLLCTKEGFCYVGAMATAFFVGALWGFIEATLGGALHAMSSPLSGSVMGPIGFALLFWGTTRGLTSRGVIVAAFVAACFKLLDPILFTMPFNHIRIINPAQAIFSQGLAFSAVLAMTHSMQNRFKLPVMALVCVPLAMLFFNFISYFVVGYKETGHLLNLSQTFLIKLPIAVLLTTGALYLAQRFSQLRFFLSPRWEYACSLVLLAVAALARVVFGASTKL